MCPKCGLPLQIAIKGSWSKTNGLQIESNFALKSMIERRKSFHNITFNTGTVVSGKKKFSSITVTFQRKYPVAIL